MDENTNHKPKNVSLLLDANYHYFVRQAVATICRWLLLSVLVTVLFLIESYVYYAAGIPNSPFGSSASGVMAADIFAMICTFVFYFVYFIYALLRLLKFHRKATKLEAELVEGSFAEQYGK